MKSILFYLAVVIISGCASMQNEYQSLDKKLKIQKSHEYNSQYEQDAYNTDSNFLLRGSGNCIGKASNRKAVDLISIIKSDGSVEKTVASRNGELASCMINHLNKMHYPAPSVVPFYLYWGIGER
jgi:hypothetical protein